MNTVIKDSLAKSLSYDAYRKMVRDLLAEGKSTGPNQSVDLLNYSTLNDARMNRLDKKTKLTDSSIKALKSTKATQIAPIINKMSLESDKVNLKVVLRDENEELMNQFLTNGTKSIPKLIVLDQNDEVISSWGPRPSIATKMVTNYKEKHGGLDANFKKELQVWYNKNKGENIQEDVVAFLEK